jgi:hypothetical protein
MLALWIVLGIVVILLIFFIATYNGLIGLRNQLRNAWAQIDVQLKRRYDLIPNLVETVKGYMKHERETLEAVTKARNLAQIQMFPSNVVAAMTGFKQGEFFEVKVAEEREAPKVSFT